MGTQDMATTNLSTPYNHRPSSCLPSLAHETTGWTLDEGPGEASSRRSRDVQQLVLVLLLDCLSVNSGSG